MTKTGKRIIIVTAVTLTVITVLLLLVLLVSGLMINGWYQSRQLFEAIKNNDCNAAQEAIDRGAWINTRKYVLLYLPNLILFNPTPLTAACERADGDMVELLIKNGADVNKTDNYSEVNPLIEVLNTDNPERFKIARFLIDNGADIHYTTPRGTGAVTYVLYEDKEESQETIQDGFELLKYLVKNGAPLCGPPVGKENCFTYVAHYGNCNALKFFIENGNYEIDSRDRAGNTALISAAKHGSVEAVKVLVEYGADVSICDSEGKTAYDYAVENGFTEITELLSRSTESEK